MLLFISQVHAPVDVAVHGEELCVVEGQVVVEANVDRESAVLGGKAHCYTALRLAIGSGAAQARQDRSK
jgi:cytoskeletal protein CcmA (bactofilin family)